MRLDAWLTRSGDKSVWSNRQPLEPFPSFRNRCVAAGWEYMERYSLHQLRRGIAVPDRLYWFRTIDEGWDEPTGMVHIIVPRRDQLVGIDRFHLGHSSDPAQRVKELEAEDPGQPLEVFQQWPGSPSLLAALHRAFYRVRTRGEWYRWAEEDVMQLVLAMDIVTEAWAHRRYWFGLGGP
jgi:hypothetical protein